LVQRTSAGAGVVSDIEATSCGAVFWPLHSPSRKIPAGKWFRKLVLVSYCDPQQTPSQPSGSVTGEPPCLAIHLPDIGRTVVVNFADREATAGSAKVDPRSVVILAE